MARKAVQVAEAVQEASLQIRMNVSIASEVWSFYPGQIITAGVEIEEATARAWLECGHASAAE